MSNMPKLSNRAKQALELLANGGTVTYKLERDSYTGREQFKRRFRMNGRIVAGLGHATFHELEKAGFRFVRTASWSVGTEYKLDATA